MDSLTHGGHIMRVDEKLAELAERYGQFLGEPVSLLGGKAVYRIREYIIVVDRMGVYPGSRIVSVRKGDSIVYISPFVKMGAFVLDFEVYDRIKNIPSDPKTLEKIVKDIEEKLGVDGGR